MLTDVVRTRALVGLSSAFLFLWFASRLFATLRGVLAFVFMHGRDRTYLHGKLVDLQLIVVSVLLMTFWVSLSAWVVVTSGRIGQRLEAAGALESAMSSVTEFLVRFLALIILIGVFTSLYRWLPRRVTDWRASVLGAAVSTMLFELARWFFAWIWLHFPPNSLYTGTLGAIIIVMFWTYYAALIFVLGAEVAHVVEMRLVEAGRIERRSMLTGEYATTAQARAAAHAAPARKTDTP